MDNKHQIRADKVLIRRVFLEEWDPIGIRQDPEAQDEYDAYLGKMYSLLASNASGEEVVAYLTRIQEDHMGLKADQAKLTAVANILKTLPIRKP